MCGIAAVVHWSGRAVPFTQLSAMARSQTHRGPDGEGYVVWRYGEPQTKPIVWRGPNGTSPPMDDRPVRVGIAHNWLAIQDTSSRAQQPMTRGDERYWIAFNGEIYNFIELREELHRDGIRMSTASDTEVLLALWEQRGPAALQALRGMFSFIIYDSHRDRLWAVRDRFGIKPLYYAFLPERGGLLLASEFRGIHAPGLVRRAWNEGALRAFLAAAINKPDDTATFFEDVYELPPGHLLELQSGHVEARSYYALPPIDRPATGREATDELRRRFLDVVTLHLRSAREVGACLSGGLDSTNIACAISRVLGPRAHAFKAFTIGTNGHPDVEMARQASKHVGFEHHTFQAPAAIGLTDLVDMIVACETPNHVWGPINQYVLLRQIAVEHAVPVLLDGQGGDEVFSGYPWFYPPVRDFVAARDGEDNARAFEAAHSTRRPASPALLQSFYDIFLSRRRWIETLDGGACAALGCSVDEVLNWAPVAYYLNDGVAWSEFREREFYRRELQLLLRQEDRLAMWFSIESRVPFLDHTFVEWVGQLDPKFLMHDGYLKYPLRILFPELPSEVRFNVTKRGFWESYGAPECFQLLARRAVHECGELRQLLGDPALIDRLDTGALWRFFQMAVLLATTSREEGRTWARDLRKNVPVGYLTVYPWLRRVGRRVLRTVSS